MSDDCKKIPQIVQGERKTLTVLLRDEDTGENTDLSGVTEVQAPFKKTKSVGNSYLIKKLERAGVAEITTIQAVADVTSSLNSKYFLFNTPTKNFAFYFDVDSNGVAPAITNRTVLAVAISENDTANDNAAALQAVMDAQAEITATVLTDTVTATNATTGEVDDPVDNGTGFTFTVTTQGVTEVTDSITIVGSKLNIVLTKEETSILSVEERQSLRIAIDFALPKGRKIVKIFDAYDVCESDFLSLSDYSA